MFGTPAAGSRHQRRFRPWRWHCNVPAWTLQVQTTSTTTPRLNLLISMTESLVKMSDEELASFVPGLNPKPYTLNPKPETLNPKP